ncbi:MAG TPA: carboxypeptidase-like regulatory domain-containing protein [Gemmatimonadales bacterium]|nr:carboxypeptidase-like regulatory domain-containing protein [Gemmatimonadales bacterium]
MTAHLACALGPFLLVALAGCAANAPPPAPRQAAFDATEYAPYARRGTGEIAGQVLFQIESDQVRPGRGKIVILAPVTSYSTEWWVEEVVGGRSLEPVDPRAAPFHLMTTADRQGRFRFENLPAGDYYLASWSGHSSADQRVGERIRLAEGEQRQVLLDDLRSTPVRRRLDIDVAEEPAEPSPPSRGSGSDSVSGRPPVRARVEDRMPTDVRVQQAVHDLKRLHIATQVREVAPGLLVARIGPEALSPGTALAYELERLYVAYSKAVGLWDRTVIELWDRRRKVGEYTSGGLLLGRE